MTIPNPKAGGDQPEAFPSAGADAPMSADQAAALKALAKDALELDAFSAKLTRSEAARRIGAFKAKLKLMSEPPHTV